MGRNVVITLNDCGPFMSRAEDCSAARLPRANPFGSVILASGCCSGVLLFL